MNSLVPIADLDMLVATRNSWHQVAEHVVAKARFVEDGRVELEAFAGGFATPLLARARRVRVDGVDIVLDEGDESRRARMATVGEAAAFVGVHAGFPTELYASATLLQPDAPLHLDRAAAGVLAAWYALTAKVLDQFAAELVDGRPSPLVLWPEHFDVAFNTNEVDESSRANYGASPGDAGHAEPYLYVGPWAQVAEHQFWNATHFNGAVLGLSRLVEVGDPFEVAMEFLRTGHALVSRQA
jgi:hypothetical protein